MLDIIFASLPYSQLENIQSAPAILKGIVKSKGYSAKTFDFGIDLLDFCGGNQTKFWDIQNYFLTPIDAPIEVEKLYDHIIYTLKKHPSRYIGISVFTVFTHKATYDLLVRLKQEQIPGKIVLGGRGVRSVLFHETFPQTQFSDTLKELKFGEAMRSLGLVDHVVYGDGEDAILEVLDNKLITINDNVSAAFRIPVPDYSDYNFLKYVMSERTLAITGSKGCVRDCDFCDVREHFGKYRFRSGKDIAEEMIDLSRKYKVRRFEFTDSLVNGNQREFVEFCKIISEYNIKNPAKSIRWHGQYICRPAKQVTKNTYSLMKSAGAFEITIGMESGSDHVLDVMNKKTTNQALLDELEGFRKHGITCKLLSMSGHHAEKFEHFVEHCKTLVRLLPYCRSGTIAAIQGGTPMQALSESPTRLESHQFGLEFSSFSPAGVWKSKHNPELTFKETLARRLIISKLMHKLKMPVMSERQEAFYLLNIAEANIDNINKFYSA